MGRLTASHLSKSEAERLHAALRGVMNTAETWRRIGDLRPHVQPFRDFGTAVLPQLIDELPQLRRFRDWLPANWRDKPSLSLDTALQVINEGVPLIWVPRAVIVSDLLYIRSIEDRLNLLTEMMTAISQDCLAVLSEITDPEVRELVPMASAAARALGGGHPWPAQALAGNVLDTWMRDAAGRGVFGAIRERNLYGQVADKIHAVSDDTTLEFFREVCVLAPVAVALSQYRPSDPVPVRFNRHATAHRVGHEQYSLANAVIGVMLVSSVLREAEESGL